MSRLRITLCGVFALTLASFGCGSDATSSTAMGHVKGKVTLAGKPVSNVDLNFNPSNIHRKDAPIASATLQADGSYEVTTLSGQNQISLSGQSIAKTPRLSYFSKTIDVKTGENQLDIEIP